MGRVVKESNQVALQDITNALSEGDLFCTSCDTVAQNMDELAQACEKANKTQGATKVPLGVASVIGGACILAAPFTAGSSVLVGGIVASGVAGVGGITHAICSYQVNTDQANKMTQFSKDLQDAAEKYDRARKQAGGSEIILDYQVLSKMGVDAVQVGISTARGLSSVKDATTLALHGGKFPVGSATMTTNELIKAYQASGRVAAAVGPAAAEGSSIASASVGGTSIAVRTVGQAGGAASESIALGGSAAAFAGEGAEAAAAAGSTASATSKVLGVVGGGLGVAVGIFDIVAGINQMKDNAKAEGCRAISKEAREFRDEVKEQLKQLRAIRDGILQMRKSS